MSINTHKGEAMNAEKLVKKIKKELENMLDRCGKFGLLKTYKGGRRFYPLAPWGDCRFSLVWDFSDYGAVIVEVRPFSKGIATDKYELGDKVSKNRNPRDTALKFQADLDKMLRIGAMWAEIVRDKCPRKPKGVSQSEYEQAFVLALAAAE